MPRLEVDTQQLGAAGGRAGNLAAHLGALRGGCAAAASGAASAGAPAARGAIEGSCEGMGQAIDGLGRHADALAARLATAAGAYTDADLSSMAGAGATERG